MMIESKFARLVQEAFADLNYDMIPILAALSPERRFAMVGDLADFARAAYVAQEQRARPDLPLDEIQRRVSERMLLDGGINAEVVHRICRQRS